MSDGGETMIPEAIPLMEEGRAEPKVPEPLLYHLRALYRDLSPNLGGEVSREAVQRARARLRGMIFQWGRGEFFT